MADLFSWLVINRLPGISPSRLSDLVSMFKTPSALLKANPVLLAQAGVSKETLRLIREYQNNPDTNELMVGAQLDMEWMKGASDRYILTIDSPKYPEQLKQIADPPILLFVQGNVDCLSKEQLAIVGSRQATPVGLDNAQFFADQVSHRGYVITSGLAIGVDGAAHTGALKRGCETIAVMGCGLNQVYPARHQALAEQIRHSGALVSEFPIGVKPRAHHFPRRNRIISGLSKGVLVIEAAVGSGSLITAEMALDQGREVFALPGSVRNPLASGCHQLIQQGAKLVTSVNDVIEELADPLLTPKPSQPSLLAEEIEKLTELVEHQGKYLSHQEEPLDAGLKSVLKAIDYDLTTVDTISHRTGHPVHQLSASLLTLEMEGLVVQELGGYVRR